MVKDHSDSEKGNPLLPHRLLFPRVLLYAPSHRQDSTYHGLCYTSCGALAGMRNSSMGPPHEGSIRWPIAPWANALTTELHLAPLGCNHTYFVNINEWYQHLSIFLLLQKLFCPSTCTKPHGLNMWSTLHVLHSIFWFILPSPASAPWLM